MKQSTNHPLRSSRRASAALAGVLLALGATLGACAEPEDFPDEFDSEARSIEVDPDAPLDAMSTPAAACEGAWAPEAVVSNDDGYMDVAADPTTRTPQRSMPALFSINIPVASSPERTVDEV